MSLSVHGNTRLNAPLLACIAGTERPVEELPETSADRAFGQALDRVLELDRQLWSEIDSAHGEICCNVQHEAYVAGFHAGAKAAKAGVL